MSVVPMIVLASTLLCLLFFVALTCDSLKGFSRHRLDDLSRKYGDTDRFLQILNSWETTLIAAETVLVLVQVAFVSAVILPGGALSPAAPAGADAAAWALVVLKWLTLVGALLLAGVVFPRAAAQVAGEAFLFRTWPLIRATVTLLNPVISLANWVSRLLHRLYGLEEADPSDPEHLAEEIRSFVDAGERLGAINAHAGDMIEQVMDLQHSDVASVMTPRTEMVCIPAHVSYEEARKAILEAGHTRVPLIGDSTDDIVGILYAKDLLQYVNSDAENIPPLSEIARDAVYVPETQTVEKLLEQMNKDRVHMAIVLDEYGGVAGLVTMEDLLEEIVGEIVDEYDEVEKELIQKESDHHVIVDGRAHLDDLIEEYGFDLPEGEDYDTVGGFVFSHLGRIPASGESFEHGNLRFTILEADPRRVRSIRIERDPSLQPVTQRDDD